MEESILQEMDQGPPRIMCREAEDRAREDPGLTLTLFLFFCPNCKSYTQKHTTILQKFLGDVSHIATLRLQ